MNTIPIQLALLASLCLCSLSSGNGYNLQQLADNQGLELHNRSTKTAAEAHPGAVYLTAASGDGVAWIQDCQFSQGAIEMEVQGADRPGQSFVGIAFHGTGDDTYDAVYVRPFNFQNPDRKNHALQYVSLPSRNWSALRRSHPGKYESSIEPAPKPEEWVRLTLEIEGRNLAVYVNGAETPELEVELINERLQGKVGLWVGNNSDGMFRNLAIKRQ